MYICVFTCMCRYIHEYNVHRIYRSPQRPILGEGRGDDTSNPQSPQGLGRHQERGMSWCVPNART